MIGHEDGEVTSEIPEADGVQLQCVNSSDFVVGKQTTFNGPVTIINYPEGADQKPAKEEIVIREKILSATVVSEIKAISEKTPDDKPKKLPWTQKFLRLEFLSIPVLAWVAVVAAITIGVLAFCIVYAPGGSPEANVPNTTQQIISYNGRQYNFIERSGWGARPRLSRVEMKSPVPYVVISHPASRFCYDRSTCVDLVRSIQGYQMSRTPPFADISYNFMVGGDGNIYEGRGWLTRNPTGGFVDGKNIDISFLGSFENLDPPTYPQTEAVKALIEFGVNNSYIDPDYVLMAANATFSTLSPGIQVYKEIKTWPHFEADPVSSLS